MLTKDKYQQALEKMKQATELVRECERLLQDVGPLSEEDYNTALTELTDAVDSLEESAWVGSPFGL